MKRIITVILVIAMIFTVGCKKEGDSNPGQPGLTGVETPTKDPVSDTTQTNGAGAVTDTVKTDENAATSTGKDDSDKTASEPNSEPTQEPTQAPTTELTPEPSPEPGTDPEGESEPEEHTYEDFLGTWYINRGEIEGYDWTAEDDENICRITFSEDHTVERVYEYLEMDPDIESGPCTFEYDEEFGTFVVNADYGRSDASFSYTINFDGELEQYGTLIYDESYEVASYAVYTREPFWGEGDYFDRYKKTVPKVIQDYIDNAPENAGLVAIADPDAELSRACTEGKWEVSDETDNQWVTCPWNNPKELIIANCSDRRVSIEVHEPKSDYDPKSEEDGWEAGPFMYFADLKPGQLCRFIVDMPDNKADATMCMYMEFEGVETEYFLRIFKYDNSDPYIVFPPFPE